MNEMTNPRAELLIEATHIARAIEAPDDQARVLQQIAQAQADNDDIEGAVRTAQTTGHFCARTEALGDIAASRAARAVGKHGLTDEATRGAHAWRYEIGGNSSDKRAHEAPSTRRHGPPRQRQNDAQSR